MRSCSSHSDATRASSASLHTLPLGFAGVHTKIARVFGVIAARSAAGSTSHVGGFVATSTGFKPNESTVLRW